MKGIAEKFKDVLKEDDLKELETFVNQKIDEKVELRVEEEKSKIELAAEEYTAKMIKEGVEKETEKLITKYDGKMEELEGRLVENMDKFLDSEITSNISDEALEKVALNETLKPIVDGIKSLFEEKHIDLDTEGHGILREAKEEIEKMEEKISTEIAEKMEVKSENDKLKSKVLVLEKTAGLSEEQKERVSTFFEGKDSDEISEKIDSFVELVLNENNEEKEETEEKENKDVISEGDGIEVEKEKREEIDENEETLKLASRFLD